MINELLNAILTCLLIADVVERRFPAEFQLFVVETSYKCIYLFSKLQIAFTQTNALVNKYIDSNPTLSKIKDNVNACLKVSGFPIAQVWIKNGKPLQLFGSNSDKNTDYDFSIVSWYSETEKCVNKQLVYEKENPDGIKLSKSSDIKFMLIEIKIGENEPYKIDLKNNDFNYYLIDNRFTKEFFIYYLINHLKIQELISNDDKFTVKIIDHDVNTIEINFTNKNESIVLEKSGYKVLIENEEKEKEE